MNRKTLQICSAAVLAVAWPWADAKSQEPAIPLPPFYAPPPEAQGEMGHEFPAPRPTEFANFTFLPPGLQEEETFEEEASRWGSLLPTVEAEAEETSPFLAATETETVPDERVEVVTPNDAGTLIQESPEVQAVNIQRRSAVAFDPRVRGYHIGQVYTQGEGLWWNPVRPDLDSMLGRLDPHLIDRLDVIPGPYSVRYGPGFAFIDADLADTPRYYNGCEVHNRTGYTIRANGAQHYAVDTFYGGSADYGFIINYSYRNGADYYAGNGVKMPSSYLLNNVSTQFGVDVAEESRLEMRYDFLDQRDTQIPGQFFNIDELESHAFLVSLIDEQCGAPWQQMRMDAWHHRTPTRGSVGNEPVFQIQDRITAALQNAGSGNVIFNGQTQAELMSSGGRTEFLFGERDGAQLRTGVDLRHMRQTIDEAFPVPFANTPFPVDTHLLPSEMFNPGLYAELGLPMNGWWTTRLGTRVDYVHTTASGLDRDNTSIPFPDDLDQDDTLYALYMMNDLQLTDGLRATIGFGEAQRPPTLVERYADGVFVSVLQSGFTRVIGNPRLAPEQLWQMDAGLYADYGDVRASIVGYHAWIQDYITYRGGVVRDPTGALLVRYVNTPEATLTGFEFKAEKDLSSTWTTFFAGHYVQGHDQVLDAPLPGISPLEGIFGLRWHSAIDPEALGAEILVRAVDAQDRLGVIRLGNLTDVGQAPVEQVTGGFTVVNVRGYWSPDEEKRLRIVGGVENLFDRTYLQHLDLRLPSSPAGPTGSGLGPFGPAFAYAPGITPYLGIDWTY